MKGIVDRIEENYVVLEVKDNIYNIEKDKFPKEIKEGDVVEIKKEKFIILKNETEERKKYIEDLFNDLKE